MARGMVQLRAALVGIAVLTSCSISANPSSGPIGGVPTAPVPETPAGWQRLVAFGTGGETAAAIDPVTLTTAPVALNATCVGSGTLVVVVATARVGEAQAAAHPSASFACHAPDAGTGRVTLSGYQPHDATVSAFVIHATGYVDFLVTVEQPIE